MAHISDATHNQYQDGNRQHLPPQSQVVVLIVEPTLSAHQHSEYEEADSLRMSSLHHAPVIGSHLSVSQVTIGILQESAVLIYKVYNVKAPRLPLASYEDRAAFKIFVLDVGLLGAMSNLKAATIVAGNSIFTEFKGALTEQYVLQQLILRYEPYYYAKTNSTQEIDFLLQDEEDEIVPLEVKAETNVKAKSLRQFVADNQPKKAYRISMNDYLQEDWVTNVPLYAVNGLEF